MVHDRKPEQTLVVGRRRAPSAQDLASLAAAVTARGPVADWVRCRVLAAAFTCALVVWVGIGLGRLAAARPPVVPAGAAVEAPAADAAPSPARTPAAGRLRDDLFRIPSTGPRTTPQEPKTNPVELLDLIQLQGVLGGRSPRAVVMYKRNQEAVTVSVGDDLGEFKVIEIRERSVVLKWREELFELSL
ncbi:MAG: hypothetical protein R6X35_05355 [Candidatus Krumholzibacteriia bacterium]